MPCVEATSLCHVPASFLRPTSVFVKCLSWLRQGGFAILDQGLFAGANFLLTILLARWLSADAYGAYALAYSIFLLLMAAHTAVLTEPMLVFGSGRYVDSFRAYLGRVLYGHGGVSALIAGVLAAGSLGLRLVGERVLSDALLALAAAAPAILVVWIGRRAFYALGRPSAAALGSGVYLTVVGAAIYALLRVDAVTPVTAFLSMGIAGAAAGGGLLFLLGPRFQSAEEAPVVRDVVESHWRYGRWSLASVGVKWVPGNAYYALLPVFVGLEGAGALRAANNLVLPMMHASSALAVLVIPRFVRASRERGTTGSRRLALILFCCISGVAVVYAALVVVLRADLFQLLYGGQYAAHVDLVYFVALLPLLSPAVTVYGGLLRALERPDLVFWAYGASTVATLTGGIALTALFGVWGAVGGLVLSYGVAASALAWFSVR